MVERKWQLKSQSWSWGEIFNWAIQEDTRNHNWLQSNSSRLKVFALVKALIQSSPNHAQAISSRFWFLGSHCERWVGNPSMWDRLSIALNLLQIYCTDALLLIFNQSCFSHTNVQCSKRDEATNKQMKTKSESGLFCAFWSSLGHSEGRK